MKHSLSFLLVVLTLGLAAPASAQIYSWRDADGQLVLSDRPRPDQGGMNTYAVKGSTSVRATKPLIPAAKSALYETSITEHSRRMGVSADLVRAVIQVESAFNPSALSTKGAMGLMQLMPATARELQVRNPYDPATNIDAGVRHLRQLLNRFDLQLAVAAYNAGAGAVQRFNGVPPFRETQAYVRQVLHLAGVS